jgi:hypothetical protein
MTDEAQDEAAGETTAQEAIASLAGTAVPECSGFTFKGPPGRNGDQFDLKIIQDSTGASVGAARGTTRADIIAHAQEIAQEFTED